MGGKIVVLAGQSWSEPSMSLSDRVYWLGIEGGLGLSLAWCRWVRIEVGWLAFVESARAVGKGVDCLPMVKPVVCACNPWGIRHGMGSFSFFFW